MSHFSSSGSPGSPYEQGELKSSPETYKSSTKRNVIITSSKERHVTMPSQSQSKEMLISKDVIEIASDEGDMERDALNIKPPQSQAGPVHREKTHKHKHKRDKIRDKQKQTREKERERDQDVYAGYRGEHSRSSERSEGKDRGGRGVKDMREFPREQRPPKVKEGKPRQKETAPPPPPREEWGGRETKKSDKEALKRKHSEAERERLENMEREKQRERRLREERERADKQRRKEEERRMLQRAEEAAKREKEKAARSHHAERGGDGDRDRGDRDRGRSGKDGKRQRTDRDRSDVREGRDKYRKDDEDRSRAKGPHTPEADLHEGEVTHDLARSNLEEQGHTPPEPIEEDEEEVEEPPSPRANVRATSDEPEADEHKTPEGDEDSSSYEEESDSGSEKSSSSDTDADERKRPAKSKFENESDDAEEEEEDDSDDDHPKEKQSIHGMFEGEGHNEYISESPPQSPIELAADLPVYLPAIQGCRSVEEFHCLNRIEEGTFGVVYRARDKKTNEIVALKRLKMEKEKEGFPITSLREINTLLKSQHVNIVTVREIVVGSNMDKIYIVMDYVEHDLKSLMETMKTPFLIGEVKTLMKQLCRAVAHLHDNWILHRDLKTSNLLLSHKGILKVGDFGLAREYGSPLKQYTPIVVTLWYRAPELLLGTKEYSKPVDMWSVGCIFAELLIMKALWPGKSEIDQLQRIFRDLGTPNEKIWEGVSELPGFKKCTFPQHPFNALRNKFGSELSDMGFDLINRMLTYNPNLRLDATTSIDHQWFNETPLPVDPSMFPTWPARSEQSGRRHVSSPKPPSGGKAYAKLLDDDEKLTASGFHMDTAAKGSSSAGPGFQLKF